MGAYHQMGHNSRNLAMDVRLAPLYAGAVMSPLNESPQSLTNLCKSLGEMEAIFDPQLFVPQSRKGKFGQWKYFTGFSGGKASTPSLKEWTDTIEAMLAECGPMGHHAICSPVVATKDFSDEALGYAIRVGDALARILRGKSLEGLQSVLVPASKLESSSRPETIASILTTGELSRLYIVPRWTQSSGELTDAGELAGFAKMLKYLAPHRKVLVGFCGPEMLLWKAAGAHSAATGKYANQQRFDLSRFQERKSGGAGTIAYYFEESLLAWLQYEDIVSLQRLDYKIGSDRDPFYPLITARIKALTENPPVYEPLMRKGKIVRYKNGKPKMKRIGPPDWTSLGWSQWLWWFADVEARLSAGNITARQLIDTAQANWNHLRVRHFIPADPENNGLWLSSWSTALKDLGL